MDQKTELPLPEAKLTLDDRVQELEGRLKVQHGILANLNKQELALDPQSQQIVGKTRKASAQVAMAFTDLDWVEALQASGITDEQISEIWETKDKASAEERNEINQEKIA